MLTTILTIYSSLVIISNNNSSYSLGFITTAVFLTSSPSYIYSQVAAFVCKSKRGEKSTICNFFHSILQCENAQSLHGMIPQTWIVMNIYIIIKAAAFHFIIHCYVNM